MKYLLMIGIGLFLYSCEEAPEEQVKEDVDIEDKELNEGTGIDLVPTEVYTEFPDAKLEFVNYKNGTFTYNISGDYELKKQTDDQKRALCANSDQGQHIHLIVDNEPYLAKYEKKFSYNLADGEHYILSFLSRSYHESVKDDEAAVIFKVTASNGGMESMEPIEEPMLFYSRPKGSYTGEDARNILLDFYLINTDLSDHKVKVAVAGEEFIVDEWQPYFIKNLPDGTHSITLTLLDDDDNIVDVPYNPVSREISVMQNPSPKTNG